MSSEKKKAPQYQKELSISEAFGRLLEHVGGEGKFQWGIFFITSISGLFFSFNSVSAAFLAASPEYKCNVPNSTISEHIEQNSAYLNGSKLWEPKCHYLYAPDLSPYLGNGSVNSNNSVSHLEECQSWSYDDSIYKSTVVTEWDLVCQKKWMMSFVQASYMAGILAGSLTLSELSDRFGRRSVSLWASVGFFISSLVTTFSRNFAMFIVMRFISACFVSGLFIANFVLVMEFCGNEKRTIMGIMYQASSGVAICILPLIAYVFRDWRNLQLAISIPSAILLLYFKVLPESPRWLFCKGKEEEAIKILRDVARVNKKRLPQKQELEDLLSKVNRPPNSKETVLTKLTSFFKNQMLLLRTPVLRRRCLIIYYSWFVVSMVYYGITFNGANLDAPVYLMVSLGGAAEILSCFCGSITLKRYGRRLNISFCYIICGVSCMLILAVPKEMVWLNITLLTIGKFFNAIAFSIAYIYSAELVPTKVRNVAVGTSSMWARVGSISAPFIGDLLGEIHYTIPSTIYGILSILAGILDLLLPETGNRPLPETIEEVEAMER